MEGEGGYHPCIHAVVAVPEESGFTPCHPLKISENLFFAACVSLFSSQTRTAFDVRNVGLLDEADQIMPGRIEVESAVFHLRNRFRLRPAADHDAIHLNLQNHQPKAPRKLLLHKSEIRKLFGLAAVKGHALVPLSFYWKNGKVKVALAVGKGKQQFDRREDLKERESDREVKRATMKWAKGK